VLGIPATLIGGSVMSVFYPRITAALHNGENARALILKATIGMAATGAIPFLLVMLTGPFLFQFVFGEAWRSAGVYAQWLSIWIFLQYINKPAVSAIPALGIQGGLLIYEVFSTGTKIIALWIGFALYQDAVIAVALFSLVGSAAYIWLILWVIHKSSQANRSKNGEATK
jgi:O-antigen/teichoic acid export membrane protein